MIIDLTQVIPKSVMTEKQKDWLRIFLPCYFEQQKKKAPYFGLTKTVVTLHYCLPSSIGCKTCLINKWESLSHAERQALDLDVTL